MKFSRILPVVLVVAALASGALLARAGEAESGLSVQTLSRSEKEKLSKAAPQPSANDQIIRLTPNRTKVVRLDRDAGSVIVSNPRHASVMIDSPRVLIVVPRAPGATALTVLDNNGEPIIERDIIVTGQEEKYIRIRKYCAADDVSCKTSSVYYCPDNCYAISTETEADAAGATADMPESVNDNMPVTTATPENSAAGNQDENDVDVYDDDLNPEDSVEETVE